jgi:adenosylcobinamide-GDP ribazoletransferase
MKNQLNLFFIALSFFSRIPVPNTVQYSAKALNHANRYFSLVGILLGLLLAIIYTLSSFVFSVDVSVLITLASSLYMTGAFHEDGLADMADGMGGGYTVQKRLAIMKDSRIGTYGGVTLIIALMLKFTLLVELAELTRSENVINYTFLWVLIMSSALSRALAASFLYDLPYVTEDSAHSSPKSKPLASAQTTTELMILLFVGLVPLFAFSPVVIFICLISLYIFSLWFKSFLIKKLGGFTGDCLGGAQQLAELIIYLGLVATAGCYSAEILRPLDYIRSLFIT